MMKFEYRPGDSMPAGAVSLGLRDEVPVEDGEFDVGERDQRTLQRIIDAGHVPLEPEALPDGVAYDPEAAESRPTAESESEESEEGGNEGDDASGGSEAGESGESGSQEEPPDLDEMDRSELYDYANNELDLGLQWSGEEALNEEEMRERIKEALES